MESLERKLTLPEGDFKAYLFDCDGTIVDSMPLHYKAWKHILDQHDCPFPEEQFYAMGRMPFAVVSGSARESVVGSLTQLGLLDRFETLVCAGDYTHSKPHPEPFLIAAERLGVAPKDCVVFEDTDMGVASAKAAGMSWVRVPQPHER